MKNGKEACISLEENYIFCLEVADGYHQFCRISIWRTGDKYVRNKMCIFLSR
ncbi:MAG: hypothetical protein UU48_C0002G0139 [Candidatus Uhrbacteria bacterium GW2011_GWF2_41_16]|uniref:Uncharacterized protein n=2 Tax=Candidatus Uhriibacteriota TaxID=1752732 RepID=A0A0G0VCK7_9BACT|nr:MAG: hypothetical protein UU31_C0003G0148 [Candidatus Uhrbacteria bacterium GW2011_GWA2_41_10]KKR87624.1 MAG: hypothetical protein UU35_C0002G0125 [Candidatus Uhrbacteria bacterium GW2011_GWC2_41_11]KKR98604.1 MAG: hypothetical protein UU48_C0002G0139 [Candidatus Uhrbacteria bacterium GW2011_GWF2_41_16]